MSEKSIKLKGSSFTLSVIHVCCEQPDEILYAIQKKIKQAPKFLKNAPVVINVSNLTYKTNWEKLFQTILATGLHIIGVSGCNDMKLKKEIALSGLPLLTEGKQLKHYTQQIILKNNISMETKTRLIDYPVRSGQKIYARRSDLIVASSVNAGAELIADGNIHIYGIMRGRALAGASGDVQCEIFCTCLNSELISIAGKYWLIDQIPDEFLSKSARFRLLNGELTIQSLS